MLWKALGVSGKLWKSLEDPGSPWKSLESLGSPWKSLEVPRIILDVFASGFEREVAAIPMDLLCGRHVIARELLFAIETEHHLWRFHGCWPKAACTASVPNGQASMQSWQFWSSL